MIQSVPPKAVIWSENGARMGKYPSSKNVSKDRCEKTAAKQIDPKRRSLLPKINNMPIGANNANDIECVIRITMSILKKLRRWSASKTRANNPPAKICLKLSAAKAATMPHTIWPTICSTVEVARGSLGGEAPGRMKPINAKPTAKKPYTKVVLIKNGPDFICNSIVAS